jgi:hypothetical protein
MPTMVGSRLFQSADVLGLSGLTPSQLREWSSRARRNLLPADVPAQGPGRHALYAWQTILALRLLKTVHTDFAAEVGAWAPGIVSLRRRLEKVSFPSLWGYCVYFPCPESPELVVPSRTSLVWTGLMLPLEPHLLVMSTKLSLSPPDQLPLFPAVA